MTVTAPVAVAETIDDSAHVPAPYRRFLPLIGSWISVAAILVVADTPVLDILCYTAYGVFAVILPGTLVFRALRRTPHTLVEDLSLGAAVGLALEIVGWAAFSWLDLRGFIMLWPLLVVVPFLAVPKLRRHWKVTGYTRVPLGWSWALAGVVVFFTAYMYATFYLENPILPNAENTRQFIDLAYQLSLAGEAKHNFPLNLPQVAGEPLNYHWFAFVHLAMGSMVGRIDLPIIAMRLMIPAICALTAAVIAVAAWRITGRRYAGVVAATLFLVVGEFNFTHPLSLPFGTQVEWIIWPSLSMTYSWALVVSIIAVASDVLRRRASDNPVPLLGPGAYVLMGLFVFASSGAKASTLPVVLAGLAFAGVLTLLFARRFSWRIVALGAIVAVGQLFATAILFKFQTYGLVIGPLRNIEGFWQQPDVGRHPLVQLAIVGATWAAFLLNMQLRLAGAIPLFWRQRGRLDEAQLFLLGAAIAGPALVYVIAGFNAGWFGRAAFPFGLVLSAWGYVLVFDKARLGRRGKTVLGVGTVVFALALVVASTEFAEDVPDDRSWAPLLPILWWAACLAGLALVVGLIWRAAARFVHGLAGRGGLVLLTGVLVAGAPGLIMDAKRNLSNVNGGGYGTAPVAKSQVDAARWLRDHSKPTDVVATNVHCTSDAPAKPCETAHAFWVSAYTERSILLEGWEFAPRIAGRPSIPFWNLPLLEFNDATLANPTVERLARMRDQYKVRFLIIDRAVRPEGGAMQALANLRYENSRMAVYELL